MIITALEDYKKLAEELSSNGWQSSDLTSEVLEGIFISLHVFLSPGALHLEDFKQFSKKLKYHLKKHGL